MKGLLKTVAYGAVDLATARRGIARTIGGQVVRFPPRWSRYYPADYEPATFEFLRAHCGAGGVALDIGAHLGLFTVVMARLVGPTGRVFAFEPTPLTRRVLERTVRLNECGGIVEVRHEAMAETTGNATFHDTGDPVSNANSLVAIERSRSGTTVPTVSLDEFVRQRALTPTCLKIDVEGAELGLLRGAEETFRRCRPAAYLALHPAAIRRSAGTLDDVWNLLRNYRMRVIQNGRPMDERAFCQSADLFDVGLVAD